MQNQEDLNAISTLLATIDPLLRADRRDAVTIIVSKILELVEKLK